MIHILYGEDDFSSGEALQKIKAQLGCGDLAESNTTVLDGKTATLDQISGVCDAVPFFASSRLVVVEGLLQRSVARKGKNTETSSEKVAGPDFASALEEYLKRMPPSTILVIVDGDIKGPNALLKRLTPLAAVQKFQMPKGDRLNEWIRGRVTDKGGKMSPGAARIMADYAGDSLWALSNEIDKLLLYSTGPMVSEDDVKETLSRSREANQFAMMDAIMSRRVEAAQRTLHQLLDEGAKAPQIVAFVLREIGLVLKAREAMEEKLPKEDISSRIGVGPGFRMDKILRHASDCTIEEIKHVYSELLDTDMAVKTGAMNEELALDMFLVNTCRR